MPFVSSKRLKMVRTATASNPKAAIVLRFKPLSVSLCGQRKLRTRRAHCIAQTDLKIGIRIDRLRKLNVDLIQARVPRCYARVKDEAGIDLRAIEQDFELGDELQGLRGGSHVRVYRRGESCRRVPWRRTWRTSPAWAGAEAVISDPSTRVAITVWGSRRNRAGEAEARVNGTLGQRVHSRRLECALARVTICSVREN